MKERSSGTRTRTSPSVSGPSSGLLGPPLGRGHEASGLSAGRRSEFIFGPIDHQTASQLPPQEPQEVLQLASALIPDGLVLPAGPSQVNGGKPADRTRLKPGSGARTSGPGPFLPPHVVAQGDVVVHRVHLHHRQAGIRLQLKQA